ncbi:hypothetical protein JVT61DRAFT_3247 [Boletus reticuloceps]|uniref:Uncharacterized protein n=1 Tax=Boletus reticuloceps TaxID=495285 RepID=A0A8I2YPD3_9AGAM|nr:hypothetical protein JVT61DRAFT_3247 [Boletus reticuloceps]
MLREQEMQCTRAEITKLEESLHSQEQSSNDKIAHLEKTNQELRNELVESRRAANQKVATLNETIKTSGAKDKSSSSKIVHLEQTVEGLRMQLADSQRKVDKKDDIIKTLRAFVRANDEQHRCEALYAAGRIHDAAELLMEIGDIGNSEARANLRIVDWVHEFTHRCATSLESIGDEVLKTTQNDEALRAYSMALSLGSSNPKTLLTKWASTMLVRGSANEVLGAASKFKLPRFLIHQAICDVLERDGHVAEAIECLQQMERELVGDKGIPAEQATWESGKEFQQRRNQA